MEKRLPLLRALRCTAYRHDERGAVTVDWVILSTAVLALGLATVDVLKPPLATVAEAVEGEVQGTDTTDGTGAYRPFDPENWEEHLTDTRSDWGLTYTELTVAIDDDDDDGSQGMGHSHGKASGVGHTHGKGKGVGHTHGGGDDDDDPETMTVRVGSGPSEEEMHDQMRSLLTDDQHRVEVGSEDDYAALQIVLEENGYRLPDDWPDYRTF